MNPVLVSALALGGAVWLAQATGAPVNISRNISPRKIGRRASGGTTDEFLHGPHHDYITGEEGPERLHLGDGEGWVEPLLPPVGARGRTVEYRRRKGGWAVTVREGGDCKGGREIAAGTGATKEQAFTRAMESTGANVRATGGSTGIDHDRRFFGGPVAALVGGPVAGMIGTGVDLAIYGAGHSSARPQRRRRAQGGKVGCARCGAAPRTAGFRSGICGACHATPTLLHAQEVTPDLVLTHQVAGESSRRRKGDQLALFSRGGATPGRHFYVMVHGEDGMRAFPTMEQAVVAAQKWTTGRRAGAIDVLRPDYSIAKTMRWSQDEDGYWGWYDDEFR